MKMNTFMLSAYLNELFVRWFSHAVIRHASARYAHPKSSTATAVYTAESTSKAESEMPRRAVTASPKTSGSICITMTTTSMAIERSR